MVGAKDTVKNNVLKLIDELLEVSHLLQQDDILIRNHLIEHLEHRNTLFVSMQELLNSERDLTHDSLVRKKLQEIYDSHKAIETIVEKQKHDASEELQKIELGKRSSELYEHGRGRVTRRNPYQATPDAAFFDKKK
ncbi:hypothetical protein BHU72_00395 [Desulfuribacillus stibiiarsenatis]|uniref:Flagellar protein FliT n=2 Tax=Desulfuribacillus stibiiarsenatis TaxID=1390249 RepID=A0A1E5L9N4_9FIRM|nr:hypothetical protein BHU72_00395 [Desulfuribacillus stibiiarsenatis]